MMLLIVLVLSGCQSFNVAHNSPAFIGPSNNKHTQFAPLSVLLSAHHHACDGATKQPLLGYKFDDVLSTFFSEFCHTSSTTTQLKMLAALHQQTNWPEAYLSYFSMLHQQTKALREVKLAHLALNTRYQAQSKMLEDTQKAITEMKNKLALIERARLSAPPNQTTSTKIEEAEL
jgi:hypothetical protein